MYVCMYIYIYAVTLCLLNIYVLMQTTCCSFSSIFAQFHVQSILCLKKTVCQLCIYIYYTSSETSAKNRFIIMGFLF